jgi:hypothetical protein
MANRTKTAAALVVLAVCLLLVFAAPAERPQADPGARLSAENGLRWYRGNLHTHSLWSDGDDYLEMIGLWYKEHGYDFLGFTDHNVLATSRNNWIPIERNDSGQRALDKLKARYPGAWVEERTRQGKREVRLKTFDEVRARLEEPGRYLLIQGEEISDRFERLPIHLNASNVREAIPPLGGDSVTATIQNDIDAVIAQRERTGQPMLVHMNHPNFHYAITAEDLMPLRGENFFEVYNGHPAVHNTGDVEHASTERIWDILLAHRLGVMGLPLLYGLATDDGHEYHNLRKSADLPTKDAQPGRGWIMVLASELSPRALFDAMDHGRFYASSGVRLSEVVSGAEGLDVTVDAEPGLDYTIEFIGTRKSFDRKSEPVTGANGKPLRATRRYSDDIGATFTTVRGPRARYRFGADDLYVRARVTSTRKHPNPSEVGEFERAWVQPARGPAAMQP